MIKYISSTFQALKDALTRTPVDPNERFLEELKGAAVDVLSTEPGSPERRDTLDDMLRLTRNGFKTDPQLALTYTVFVAKFCETGSTPHCRPIAALKRWTIKKQRTIPDIQQQAFADILEYTKEENRIDFRYDELSYKALSFVATNAPAGNPIQVEAQKRIEMLDIKRECLQKAAVRHDPSHPHGKVALVT